MNPFEEVLKVKGDMLTLIDTLDNTDLEYFDADDLYALVEVAKLLEDKAYRIANMLKFD